MKQTAARAPPLQNDGAFGLVLDDLVFALFFYYENNILMQQMAVMPNPATPFHFGSSEHLQV